MTGIAIQENVFSAGLFTEGVMQSLALLVGVAAVTVTVSNIEQRQLERQRVLEQGRALSEEVVVWQTMF